MDAPIKARPQPLLPKPRVVWSRWSTGGGNWRCTYERPDGHALVGQGNTAAEAEKVLFAFVAQTRKAK
jgi:hypothetical protein